MTKERRNEVFAWYPKKAGLCITGDQGIEQVGTRRGVHILTLWMECDGTGSGPSYPQKETTAPNETNDG